MIKYDEYGHLIRPDYIYNLELKSDNSKIEKAIHYNEHIDILFKYIIELENELEKNKNLPNIDKFNACIKTLESIQNLTLNILPLTINSPS